MAGRQGVGILTPSGERALDVSGLMDDLLRDRRITHQDHIQVLNRCRSQEEALAPAQLYRRAKLTRCRW